MYPPCYFYHNGVFSLFFHFCFPGRVVCWAKHTSAAFCTLLSPHNWGQPKGGVCWAEAYGRGWGRPPSRPSITGRQHFMYTSTHFAFSFLFFLMQPVRKQRLSAVGRLFPKAAEAARMKRRLREQEQLMREQTRREQELREQDHQELQLREEELREQQLRNQECQEQQLREQDRREQELREQQLRQQERREQQLMVKNLQEQQARKEELREQQLRDQELRKKQMKSQELMDKKIRAQELRKQRLREQELREQRVAPKTVELFNTSGQAQVISTLFPRCFTHTLHSIIL